MVLTTNQNSVCQSQTIQELSNLAKPSGVQESPLNILQLSSSNIAAMNSLNKYMTRKRLKANDQQGKIHSHEHVRCNHL